MLTVDLHDLIPVATAKSDAPTAEVYASREDGSRLRIGYAARTAGGGSWVVLLDRDILPAGHPARTGPATASSLPGALARLREAEAGGRRIEGGRFLETAAGDRLPVGGLFSGAVELARAVENLLREEVRLLSAA